MRALVAIFAWLVLTGAASDKNLLREANKRFPDAHAVILEESQRYRCESGTSSCTLTLERKVVLRHDDAAELATFRHILGPGDGLIRAEGTAILPSGKRFELGKEDVVLRTGGYDAKTGVPLREAALPLPGAVRGARFNHRFVVSLARPRGSDLAFLDGPWPRLDYRYEAELPAGEGLRLRAWNSRNAIERETIDGGFTRWGWHSGPLAGRPPEPSARPASISRPYWIMIRDPQPERWVSVAGPWLERLGEDWRDLTDDVVAPPRPEGQGPITWAFDFVRSEIENELSAPGRLRPLQAVLDSGKGSPLEKALLLRYLLEREGVVAHVAASRAPERGPIPSGVISPLLLTDALVAVPPDSGLGALRWLDPTRLRCDIGQLPRNVVLTEALLVETDQLTPFSPINARTRTLNPNGDDCRAVEDTIALSGILQPDGALVGELELGGFGPHLEPLRKGIRDRGPGWIATILADYLDPTLRERLELRGTRGEAGARPGEAQVVAGYLLRGAGVVALGMMVVPLDVLAGPLDRSHWPPERETTLRIDSPRRFERTIELTAPSGYRLAESLAPSPARSGPVGRYELAVSESGGRIRITRRLELAPGDWSPARYGEFLTFLNDAARDLQRALVFVPQ